MTNDELVSLLMLSDPDSVYAQAASAIETLQRQLEDMTEDYLRRHNDAADSMLEVVALKRQLAEKDAILTAEYERSNARCDTLERDYEEIISRKDVEICELNKANVAYVDANTILIRQLAEKDEALKEAVRMQE